MKCVEIIRKEPRKVIVFKYNYKLYKCRFYKYRGRIRIKCMPEELNGISEFLVKEIEKELNKD